MSQHEGGLKSLKIKAGDDYIWNLSDEGFGSDDLWWVGQTNFSTYRVRVSGFQDFLVFYLLFAVGF